MSAKRIKEMFSSWLSRPEAQTCRPHVDAAFKLRYRDLPVGSLTLQDGRWKFSYTDEFRKAKLRPIVEFPDVDKEYVSDQLWPFFVLRIPGLKQSAVHDILEREHIDEGDEAELLRRFGKRTIFNPFELVADESEESCEHCASHS